MSGVRVNAPASTSTGPSVPSPEAFSNEMLSYPSPHELPGMNDSVSSESIPEELKRLLRSGSVFSTETLIEAVNATSDGTVRDVLIKETLNTYVCELEKQQTLSTWDARQLKEFAILGGFHPSTPHGRCAVRSWFGRLTSKVDVKHEDALFIEVLNFALLPLEPEVFEHDSTPLTNLARILLEKLNPETMPITNVFSARQRNILCALYRTFQLTVLVYPMEYDMSKDNGPVEEFKKKVDEIIEASSGCFPMLHYAMVIQQNMLKLRTKDAQKWAQYERKTLWKILRGVAHLWSSFQLMMTTATLDLKSIEEAIKLFQEAWNASKNQLQHQWFDVLEKLNTIAMHLTQDSDKLPLYLESLNAVMKKVSSWRGQGPKHLVYGIIEQLTMLALNERCVGIQEELIQQLTDLTCRRPVPIATDEDISSFLNDCLAKIVGQSVHQGDSPSATGTAHTHPAPSDSLFLKIKHRLIGDSEEAGTGNPSGLKSKTLELLKSGYITSCSRMDSPIMGPSIDVSTLRFSLMRIDDTEKVLTSCNCVDLGSFLGRELVDPEFKTRIDMEGLFPDDRGVRRVLVMGMPGSGRSGLAHRLALDWSKEQWGMHFTTVFLLRLSPQLIKDKKVDPADPSLSGAIVRTSFAHLDREPSTVSDELRKAVQDELKKPTTLVILHGMEEARGFNILNELAQQAKCGEHKLLMILRPSGTNIKEALEGNDLVVELSGHKDEDLHEHLCVHDSTARSVLDEFPALQGMARNPLNCRILCSLLSTASADARGCGCQRSVTWFCRRLVTRLWKRCDKKNEACELDANLDDLGRMAFIALTKGQCRFRDGDLDDLVQPIDNHSILIRKGFLVCNCEGEIEFTHSTLMQYFAARFLAKYLFEKSTLQSEAEDCVRTKKYVPKYADPLSMMAGEIGSDKGAHGIQKLIQVVDEGDVESLGIHHLGLKMNALQQWLRASDTKTGYGAVVREMKVVEKLEELLGHGIQRVQHGYKKAEAIDDALLKAVIRLVKDNPYVIARDKAQLANAVRHLMDIHNWDVDPTVAEAFATLIDVCRHDTTSFERIIEDNLNKPQTRDNVLHLLRLSCHWPANFCREVLEVLKVVRHFNHCGEYGDVVLDLFGRVPDCSDDEIKFLAKIFRETSPSPRTIAEALPKILTTMSRISQFVRCLEEENADSMNVMSPAIIEAIGVCMKNIGQADEGIVKRLLNAWPRMNEESREAASQTLIEVIRLNPEKAPEIIKGLTLEETDTPQVHSMTVLQQAAHHQDPSIEVLAFHAMGITARQQADDLPDELIQTVIQGCEREEVQAKCAALEALKAIVASYVDTTALLPKCHELLMHPNDTICKLAGEVLTVAAKNPEIQGQTISKLLQSYQTSTDETVKHGIVHCLHLVVQKFHETPHDVESIFVEAAKSSNPKLCTAGISAFPILTQGNDMPDIIDALKRACQRDEGNVQLVALEAIETCLHHGSSLLESLMQTPDRPSVPQNDKVPREEREAFLKALLTETSNEAKEVRNKRREIVDRLSLESLLYWYKIIKEDLVLDHISRRFYQSPILIKNSTGEICDLAVEDKVMLHIDKLAAEKLHNRILLPYCSPTNIGRKTRKPFSSFLKPKLRRKGQKQ